MREIGQMLREGRQALGLEIADIARQTCINPFYIKAMEDGRFQIIPKVFDKGYIKIYAKCLRMDIPRIMTMYDQMQSQSLNR